MAGSCRMHVRFFTTAMRKVSNRSYPLPEGPAELDLPLSAGDGRPLANGLYYVVVDTPQQSVTLKLVLLH